jgi:hypothetical protein
MLVSEEQRDDWEAFTSIHGPQFVAEAWNIQSQDDSFQGSLDKFPRLQKEIYTNYPVLAPIPRGKGPYHVLWQNYPIVYQDDSAPYNYDINSFPPLAGGFNNTISTKRPSLTGFNLLDVPAPFAEIAHGYLEKMIPKDESPSEPVTSLVYPIIDQDGLDLQLSEDDINNGDVVGTISFGFFWRDLLRDILPESSQGILAVTEISCAQMEPLGFTYEINGAVTNYLGLGDFSDQKYHYLELSTTLMEIMDIPTGTRGRTYTGIPLSESACPIRMKLYPSEKSETSHYASRSVVFTICSVVVFLFAALLFALYDLLVKRRQRKVADVAARSFAILSDVFPKEVHKRLYKAQDEYSKDITKNNANRVSWAIATNRESSLSSDSVVADDTVDDSAIADIYPCK